MSNVATYSAGYNNLFAGVQIKPGSISTIDAIVKKINAGKARYQAMEAKTNVPWFFIGVLHYMEAGNDFSRHLHNGDPLTRRTVQEPAGRPTTGTAPFTWEASALDAIKYKGLDKIKSWDIANMLYLFEAYNGFGYRSKGINSPYLWSMSNQYIKGKYVADGKYDANAVSKQAGAAVIMYRVLQQNNLLAKYVQAAAAGGTAIVLLVAAFFF
jgi:lysozyme family protein